MTTADLVINFSGGKDSSAMLHLLVSRYAANHRLQFLLDQTVSLLADNLPADAAFGDVVSFDTKHVLAWVKENNPKEHIAHDRFDKHQQPQGDRDCKLGCKRRSNQDRRDTPATSATSAIY